MLIFLRFNIKKFKMIKFNMVLNISIIILLVDLVYKNKLMEIVMKNEYKIWNVNWKIMLIVFGNKMDYIHLFSLPLKM